MTRPRRVDFGGWFLDRKTLCLVYRDGEGRELYDVALQRCQTSAAVLDWILQVAKKSWATPAIVACLVHALDFHLDPQATLCSFRQKRGPIDAVAVARQRLAR